MKKIIVISLLYYLFTMQACAEEIRFNEFLSSALTNSYKLKTSQIDVQIAQKGIKEAKAGYYPTLNAFATTERYNDLTDGNSSITAVGNEILLNRSYYQDMAAIGLSYNIFDFGVRRNQLDIAKADDKQKIIVLMKDTRDLKLDAVDIYAQSLFLYKQFKIKKDTLLLQSELAEINKRLKNAGELTSTDVIDSEIKVSETKTELEEIENNLAKKLTEVSYFTNQTYDLSNIVLNDFPNDLSLIPEDVNGLVKLSVEINQMIPENSPEALTYDLEILKKQKEYEIQKKYNYPKIRFDTRYNFYGSDPHNFFGGVGDIGQRSVTIRVSTSFVFFDGYKNINTIAKKKMEVEKLKIEKEKQLAELKKKYEQIRLDAKNCIIQSENNARTLELVNTNIEMLERMNINGFLAKSECIKKRLILLDKKLKLEENQIKNFVVQYKLQVLSTETSKL